MGGKTFPSGFLFANAMNEYHKQYNDDDSENFEIVHRLLVMHSVGRKMRDELGLGLFNPHNAEKLYDEIVYKINVVSRAKPFCYLDLDTERERCRQLFSDETAEKICEYLHKRALFYNKDQTGWANHPLPQQSDIDDFRDGEALLQDYIKTIDFYEELGYGMDNAYQIGRAFVAALDAPVKRNEGNLMTMAQQCVEHYRPHGFIVFDRNIRVNMEYVSVQKNKTANQINRRMTFERFGDFLLADFFEGLHVGHYPLQCGVCKRYFLQTTAHQRMYCDGYAPDDPKGRTCQAYAARSNRLEKELSTNRPLNQPYNTRRGTIDKHLQRGKITLEQANAAKQYIENLHDRAELDNDYLNSRYKQDMEQSAVYAAVEHGAGFHVKRRGHHLLTDFNQFVCRCGHISSDILCSDIAFTMNCETACMTISS